MRSAGEQRIVISVDDLKAGDIVEYTAVGGPTWTDVTVIGLLHGRGGRLIGFFPAAALGVDPGVAVEIERAIKAWRVKAPPAPRGRKAAKRRRLREA